MQERACPLRMQLVHGNEPLHRFLEALHFVHAVLARRRFSGLTLGRPMMESGRNAGSLQRSLSRWFSFAAGIGGVRAAHPEISLRKRRYAR